MHGSRQPPDQFEVDWITTANAHSYPWSYFHRFYPKKKKLGFTSLAMKQVNPIIVVPEKIG